MNREQHMSLAQETLDILRQGRYRSPSGQEVNITADLEAAVSGSRLYRPGDFPNPVTSCPTRPWPGTTAEVTEETTLQAAQRLAASDPLCLNFASAKNPGGGFLSGSQAQEESLARSSGLYSCLVPMSEMYDHNRRLNTCLYSDYMVYSPRVPVFRADDGSLLEAPFTTSFLTAPAPNAGAVRKNEPGSVGLIRPTMAARMGKILWIAQEQGHSTLVLGAWGCGVFGNEPRMVAELFSELLGPRGMFFGCFERVVYAVFDRSPGREVLFAFQRRIEEADV